MVVLPDQVLDRQALNRALLARQLLLERATVPVLEALEHLVGLQAQAPRPPYLGLWTRLAGFDAMELEELILERRVVRTALQRGTIHAVSSRTALTLRPLLQPLFDRGVRQLQRRLAGASSDAVAATARGLLADQPLTFAQLGRALNEHWPKAEPTALAQTARGALALVQVPPRGLWTRSGPAAHTTVEAWLGASLDSTGTVEQLLVRYLAAFGPASVADAQAWSGLSGLNKAAAGLRPRLQAFHAEDGRELLDLPNAPRPHRDTPAPVRFLPPWENLLRAHQDRSRVISDENRAAIQRPNDVVPGTVLVDGYVAATWEQRITATSALLNVDPLQRLNARSTKAIRAEGRSLLLWSAPHLPEPARQVTITAPP